MNIFSRFRSFYFTLSFTACREMYFSTIEIYNQARWIWTHRMADKDHVLALLMDEGIRSSFSHRNSLDSIKGKRKKKSLLNARWEEVKAAATAPARDVNEKYHKARINNSSHYF